MSRYLPEKDKYTLSMLSNLRHTSFERQNQGQIWHSKFVLLDQLFRLLWYTACVARTCVTNNFDERIVLTLRELDVSPEISQYSGHTLLGILCVYRPGKLCFLVLYKFIPWDTPYSAQRNQFPFDWGEFLSIRVIMMTVGYLTIDHFNGLVLSDPTDFYCQLH